MYIPKEFGEHEFHDLQFGLVGNKGTLVAAALINNIIDNCVNTRFPVYICALDTEAALGGIPHAIMF
jgi:hypothetical protein